jgi:hypothetical protein
VRAQKFLRRRGSPPASRNGRLRFANPSPVDWYSEPRSEGAPCG